MVEETEHILLVEDAREVDIPSGTIDLVVTSPPYPMIEMWDELYSQLDPAIGDAIEEGDGMKAFELMHDQLEQVWEKLGEAVVDGGFVCVNVGDATRTIGGSFQVYPNTAQIIETFRELGFHVLPRIYWKKPTNSTTAFLGSGTLPPNAYPKLEHEQILIFRKGESKTYEPKAQRRYESAYFYEERNQWFSDQWDDVRGASQAFDAVSSENDVVSRERTGAFPIEIPYRLVNMFTVYGDVVCDPFVGTGTTNLAAMLAGRHSIGVEIKSDVAEMLDLRIGELAKQSREMIGTRIKEHQDFVQVRVEDGNPASYTADHYPFDVVTKQEKQIRFYEVVDYTGITEDMCKHLRVTQGKSQQIGYQISYDLYGEEIPVRLDKYS